MLVNDLASSYIICWEFKQNVIKNAQSNNKKRYY